MQNVDITSESLFVKGNVDLENNADVGSTSNRVETYVGGNCRYAGGAWTTSETGVRRHPGQPSTSSPTCRTPAAPA